MINRKKLILAILLLLFAAAIIYALIAMPRQKSVDTLTYRVGERAAATKKAPPAPADDKRVHLELLGKDTPRFSGYRRNIFLPIPLHEAKIAAVAAEKKRKAAPPPPPPPPAKEMPPPPPPAPPTPREKAVKDMEGYQFLGYLQKGPRRTVFLSRNKEIQMVKKGDTITVQSSKYTVSQITDDSMTVVPAGSNEEVVIPLAVGK